MRKIPSQRREVGIQRCANLEVATTTSDYSGPFIQATQCSEASLVWIGYQSPSNAVIFIGPGFNTLKGEALASIFCLFKCL